MAKDKDELTPMMRQYNEIKKEHQDKVLFFRLGDFYEMFKDDAVEVSKLLNLTLTHRANVPMCGIPYHAAKNYIARLLEAGKKIAICEQMNLPDNPRQLAERKVIQIYTPATVVEDEYLDSLSSSFILSVNRDKKDICLAYADITSGDFFIRKVAIDDNLSSFNDALYTVMPKEVIARQSVTRAPSDLRPSMAERSERPVEMWSSMMRTRLPFTSAPSTRLRLP